MRAVPIRITTAAGICAALVAATVVAVAPPVAADPAANTCPDIHILAVQGTTQSSVNAPTDDDTGELSAVIIPVLNAARAQKLRVERTYIPYPASFGGLETQSVAADYKTSVLDGYNRLSQVAARVEYQCPTTKLVLLGDSQGGHAVSMLAQQIAAGQAGTFTQTTAADGSSSPDTATADGSSTPTTTADGSSTPDTETATPASATTTTATPLTPGDIALVATFGDPTRGPDAPLFPGRPGQVGPDPWPGIDQKTRPSVTKFGDLYSSPKGQGIGPTRDIAKDFGPLDGHVVQWCLNGDLACSAPKSISLAKVGLEIAGQSSLDFTHDPFGVAGSLAAATANTFANGMSTFMDKDVKGKNLADVYFDGNASISKRLEDAADPRNAEQQTNPLVAVLKSGQMIMSSMTTFLGSVLNSATLGSLINAGVQIAGSAATGAATAGLPALAGGPVAAAAAASAGAAAGATAGLPGLIVPAISILGNTATAALNIVPPQSAEKKVSSIFDLLINEVKANQDLPQLLTDSRFWNQQATHGGYHTTRVAMDGSTPMDITADWIIAAARDLKKAAGNDTATKNPPPGTTADTTTPSTTANPAPVVNAAYNRDNNGNVINPLQTPPGAAAAAKTDTPGDVRITTNGQPTPPVPTKPTPLTWVADGANSIATRVVATDPNTPAGALLHLGSPVLAAAPATVKEVDKQ